MSPWADPSTMYKPGHFSPPFSPLPPSLPTNYTPTTLPTAIKTDMPTSLPSTFYPYSAMPPASGGVSSCYGFPVTAAPGGCQSSGFPVHLASTLPTPFSSPPLTPSPVRAPVPMTPNVHSPRRQVQPLPSPLPHTFSLPAAPLPTSSTQGSTINSSSLPTNPAGGQTSTTATTTPILALPFADKPPIYAFTREDLENVLYGYVRNKDTPGYSCALSGLHFKGMWLINHNPSHKPPPPQKKIIVWLSSTTFFD